MKLCQIVYTGFGGLGSVAFSLAAGMPQSRPHLAIAFVGDQPLEPSYAARCETLGIEYAEFQFAGKRRIEAWHRLACWLERIRADAVICHSITSILGAWWYTRRHGARLIAVEHMANHVKSRNDRLGSLLAMLVAEKVVLLTEDYKTELLDAHPLLYRRRKMCVIPNGIDVTTFHPPRARTPSATFRLGMAARFSFSKRQDLLVAAFRSLHALCPETSFVLSFAGDGSELQRVKELSASSVGHGQIEFEGFLDEGPLAEWFRGLDLYVHATDGETLSTALLQAMATGVAIVASDVPGVRNLLSGGSWGCCVPNDEQAFATAITKMVRDPDRRQAMGNAGRERAARNYSVQRMAAAYLSLCES